MKPIEITNRIYTYFVQKGYRPKLDISLDGEEEAPEKRHIQIQIDVDLLGDPRYEIGTTAFFYALDDPQIYMSAIFFLQRDLEDGEWAALQKMHGEVREVFSAVIKPEEDNEIHLFHEIELDAFDETVLDRITDFFHGDGALLKKLKELTKKTTRS